MGFNYLLGVFIFMIINGQLSLSDQKTGRHQLILFSFMNGFALTFIAGNVLSLYLLKIGFSTTTVAILTSFCYIGTLFSFTGKWLIARFGASFTIKVSWLLCGIFAIFLALIPFAYYRNIITKPELLLIISIIILILFVFKAIGTTSIPPLMAEFTDDDNRGKFSSRFFLFYNLSTFIAILSLIFLYSGYKNLFIFQVLIFLSGIIKLSCSMIFIKMRETDISMQSAKAIKADKFFYIIWKTPQYRKFLLFKSLSRAGMILIIPISILALKTTYGVNDQTILIFVCIQMVGGFIISYIYGIISEYTGPKPLIIINLLTLFFICLLWVYIPHSFIWVYCAFIFFLGGVCTSGLDSSLNHYFLTIIPKKYNVGTSLWFTTIGGAVAGISGIVLGGGFIKLYTTFTISNNAFHYYYATMLILLIPALYYVCSLENSSTMEWSVRKVLKLLIAPIKIYSLYSMRTHRKYLSQESELGYVYKFQGLSSDLTQKHFCYYLESPDFAIRSNVLMNMYYLKLENKTLRAVYKVFKNRSVISSSIASNILAKNNFRRAIPLLRKRLILPEVGIAGGCMIALAIMNDKESNKQIIEIFKKSNQPILIFCGARAIAEMKDISNLGCLLEKMTRPYILKNSEEENEIILAISMIISCNKPYYKYLRILKNDAEKGLLGLLELIDTNLSYGTTTTPQAILEYYYSDKNDIKRKIKFIEFLEDSLIRSIHEMKELKIFKDYFTKTKPDNISENLLACIFIKLFCKN